MSTQNRQKLNAKKPTKNNTYKKGYIDIRIGMLDK